MTASQKLALKLSEQRERLNHLAGLDNPSDDERAELDTLPEEYQTTEARWRAALTAEAAEAEADPETHATTGDAEARERAGLRDKASLGGYLMARAKGVLPGELAEYGAACGAEPGSIPLDLFEAERPVETHADATTPAPSTGTGSTVGRVHPWIFDMSIAVRRLGIQMPQVGSGAYSEMTIGTPLTASARAKGSAVESTEGALTSVTTKPRSISARLSIAAEDVAEVGTPRFEAALRSNLQGVFSDEYDKQCISGNGTAPNISGLVGQLTRGTNPTAVVTFDSFLSTAAGFAASKWAEEMSDLIIVVPPDVYRKSVTTFRDSTGANGHRGDISAQKYLKGTLGGWYGATRLPNAPATGETNANVSQGIVRRTGAGVVGAVHPTWASISIDDIYSDSASAIRHYTMHVLVGAKLLLVRPAGEIFDSVLYKVA